MFLVNPRGRLEMTKRGVARVFGNSTL
jgi:hypothetical protein